MSIYSPPFQITNDGRHSRECISEQHMSDAGEPKFSKEEFLKEGSHQLRGTIAHELAETTDCFIEDNAKLLKYHGTYQQDDKDHRKDKNADGTRKGKAYMFMVRTRIPGGKVTAEQLLAELDLCDRYGNGTLRITSRQGFQLHGVLKENLREAIRGINHTMLTTLAACGDVERNVMCCPAPYNDNAVRRQMQEMADRVAEHLKPRTTGVLRDLAQGRRRATSSTRPSSSRSRNRSTEPATFRENSKRPSHCPKTTASRSIPTIWAFWRSSRRTRSSATTWSSGGGMGVTPSATRRFPPSPSGSHSSRPTRCVDVAEAIVKVQRDFGNREDRKVARLKYLIANWGIPKFKAKVEEYYGRPLVDPNPIDVTDVDDHIGWHDQGDGKLFLGVNIEMRPDQGRRRFAHQNRPSRAAREIRDALPADAAAVADPLRHRPGRTQERSSGC